MSEKEQGQSQGKYPSSGMYPGAGQYPGMGSYPGSGQYPGMGPDDGISVNELVSTLWRRKVRVVVTAGIVGFLASVWSLSQTPSFKAEARVLLEEGAPSTGVLG
ncbi:MAG TPA: Wzz/FepE/Etk N-terminal domain-containing protein, partial [Planctomycetota bacterium]|nr:Wzz/FepE/Etk N-terminal domain-containing protein [Planctomycetota bacterium]